MNCMQVVLAREYLKDVTISKEQIKYLVTEAIRGGVQVFIASEYFETLFSRINQSLNRRAL